MPNQFDVNDPLGRKIFCTKEQWAKHVVGFKPFMAKYLDEVRQTIEEPDEIYPDAQRKDRECYYRYWKKNWPNIRVVVEFSDPDVGNLITAFPSRNASSKEKPKYKKS